MFGAAIGLCVGFSPLFFGTLSVFLKPIAVEFGWSRAGTSTIVTMSMLGLAIGSPVVGALIDRFGPRRVLGASVLLFSALVFTCSVLPADRLLWSATSFMIGALGVGTGPAGYLAVLPRAFNRRLGTSLSLAMRMRCSHRGSERRASSSAP